MREVLGDTDSVPILRVRNLTTRYYAAGVTVHAVNGISYDLQRAEVLAVVGESGSGKTAHALSIMRLIPRSQGRITDGEIIFDGRDLLALPERQMREVRGRDIAMIFQDPMASLNPVVPIGEQIAESVRLHTGASRTQARRRAVELLGLVGIPSAAARVDAFPHQFSGGMRQRVMIAIALSCDPKVLIADEPTTALDVTIQAQIIALLKDLSEQLEVSIIWITHDLGVVAGVADRVLVMYGGRIVEQSDVDDLFADPRHPYTQSLLRARPRIDKRVKEERLVSIGGRPISLTSEPTGCPFMPRCPKAMERCREMPPSFEVGLTHSSACWLEVEREVQRRQ